MTVNDNLNQPSVDLPEVETTRPPLRFKRLHKDAVLPVYKTAGSAGLDLTMVGPAVSLSPGQRTLISIGWAIEIPEGFEGQIRPRSGLALTKGLTVLNAPGTIDSDYRGEVKVLMVNLGRFVETLETGMRIAQLVIAPVCQGLSVCVEDLAHTMRGDGGFGSTGLGSSVLPFSKER